MWAKHGRLAAQLHGFSPRMVLTRPYPLPATLLTLGLWL